MVEPAWFQRLKLKCETPLSSVAFDGFKLRPYGVEGYGAGGFPAWGIPAGGTLLFTIEVLSIKGK